MTGNGRVGPTKGVTDGLALSALVEELRDSARGEEAEALVWLVGVASHVQSLLQALAPFARLVPSSFYPADGSEGEGYVFYLGEEGDGGNQFTGSDLAKARAAHSAASEVAR